MNVQTPIPGNGGDWLEKFGELWRRQIEAVRARFDAALTEVRMPPTDLTDVPILYVRPEKIVEVLAFMKEDAALGYDFLSDLTATDELEESGPRFEIVYNLYSLGTHARIRVKTRVDDGQDIPSLAGVWPGASWAEREVFDMFGIVFSGHPDLRRILNDKRFQGYPLRKDYPLKKYQIFTEAEPVDPKLLE